jgi:hypothetical protein
VSHRTEEAEVVAVQSRCEDANLLFEVGAKSVSAMRIEATGTILENLNDARKVKVAGDRFRRCDLMGHDADPYSHVDGQSNVVPPRGSLVVYLRSRDGHGGAER